MCIERLKRTHKYKEFERINITIEFHVDFVVVGGYFAIHLFSLHSNFNIVVQVYTMSGIFILFFIKKIPFQNE